MLLAGANAPCSAVGCARTMTTVGRLAHLIFMWTACKEITSFRLADVALVLEEPNVLDKEIQRTGDARHRHRRRMITSALAQQVLYLDALPDELLRRTHHLCPFHHCAILMSSG